MSNNYKSTKIKVGVGYILLALLLIFAVGYIYKEMKKLTGSGDFETELSVRRKATNQVMLQLYQTEIISQSLSTGKKEDYPQYKKSINKVNRSIKNLEQLLSDSIQIGRLDTIVYIIREKEKNILELMDAVEEYNRDFLSNNNINKILKEQDSLLRQQLVQHKVITHQDSYTVKNKHRGFLQRLGDVFTGGKPDSTTIIKTRQELLTDTLVNDYNPADTIAVILRDIQTNVNNRQAKIEQAIHQRITQLQQNSWELSNKVNLILNAFEEEELLHSQQKLLQEKQIRKNSAKVIATIAIVAIVLVILFIFIIERDITRSHHYRIELEKAKKRAEDLLIAREKMMLTITHDIKAPAASIIGYVDLLSRLVTDERQHFYLNNMHSSASHLLNLVNSLLDFHRLDSHKMEISCVPFNPKQLFDTIYTSFKPLAEGKHLTLAYESDEVLDSLYTGDPFRIRQIAENLLTNALKFTKNGSITLHTEYNNNSLCFAVTDTGTGIAPEEQQKLFQEFTRLHNAQGEEGFGLGLAITKKLVTLLNGELQLESEQGKGSSFRITIPLPIASGSQIEESALPQPEQIAWKRKVNLLLIDDDRIQLNLTAAMLNRPEIKVTCCEQPKELFKLLENQSFDVLLTDIQMPAMNGFELVDVLRSLSIPQAKTIPVVALTARSDMNLKQFIDEGFAGCLHKPFTYNEVLAELSRILGVELKIEKERPRESIESNRFYFGALTAFSEGDKEAAKEIIQTFVTETEKNRESLLRHLQSGEMKGVKAISHKLLPLVTLLEAQECRKALTWLEQSPLEEVTDEVTDKVHYIESEIKQIIQQAEEML